MKTRVASLGAVIVAAAALFSCGGQTKDSAPSGPKTVKSACGMEMVSIPSGEFTMGANDGPIDVKPAHPVKIEGFLIDQCEITQEVYLKVTGKDPSRRKNPKNPVEQVTWSAAAKFCNARSTQEGLTPCYDLATWECNFAANGYRLPTEAEWEYACRAGNAERYYFGEAVGDLSANAWFQGNSQAKPHPVGQRKPNAFGLYDMTGNVWEWCNDFYGVKYYRTSPPDNPRGPQQGEKRVLRGGAWSSAADQCISWVRNCDEAGTTDVCLTMDSNGFRCVRRK